jgi:thiol-disulfide isomerase/thioredoxin
MSDSTRGGIAVAIIIFALAVYYFVWVKQPTGGPSTPTIATTTSGTKMEKGKPAPDFTAVSTDGKTITLSSFKGQKPVVLDFWATWCGPCMMELPKLEEFYQQHSGDVEIIAISSEENSAAGSIQGVVTKKGLTFPVIHDSTGKIQEMFPSTGIPYLIFIDKNGIVVNDVMGYNPEIGQEILSTFGL